MILPNLRASFGRAEASYVVGLLAGADAEARRREELRLREDGFDALLDDPRTFNALMSGVQVAEVPARLAFYLLVRHALLESGVNNRAIADYLGAMLLEFGRGTRAQRSDDAEHDEYHYLVDIVEAMGSAAGPRRFLLRAHLGNYALWVSGLFPERIAARVQRRAAPGLDYFEELGAAGYRLAAECRDAADHGLESLFLTFADGFPTLRGALNRVADRYLFPTAADPVERLLRQVADRLHHPACGG